MGKYVPKVARDGYWRVWNGYLHLSYLDGEFRLLRMSSGSRARRGRLLGIRWVVMW